MAVSFVDSADTGSDLFVTSRSVAVPLTVSDGDIAVCVLTQWHESFLFQTPSSAPVGAVLRGEVVNEEGKSFIYLVRINGHTDLTFSWTNDRWSALHVLFFSGVDAGLDLSTVPFNSATGAGTAIGTTTVATVNEAGLAWHVNTTTYLEATTHEPPTNFTEVTDFSPIATAWRISPGDGSQSAAGATIDVGTVWSASLVALAPPLGGAGEAEAASIVLSALNAGAGGAPGAENVTFTVAAHNATVVAGGAAPQVASVSMAGEDASVQTSNIDAEEAVISLEAPFEPGTFTDLDLVADNPIEIAVAALDAMITASETTTAGAALLSVTALDATIAVAGNVNTQAQEANIAFAAQDAVISTSSNISAEAATISFVSEDTDKRALPGAAEFGIVGHNAASSIAEGTLANSEEAEISVTAFNAAITVAGENVTAEAQVADITLVSQDAVALDVEPPPPTYTFFPPTVFENLTYDDPFLERLQWERGLSVVKRGGEYITVRYVVPDNLDGRTEGIHYFVGGFHYSGIPESVALELIDAGYAPELEV